MNKRILFLFLLLTIIIEIISPVQAKTFDGEYSIEYLLKNYNVITLGHGDIRLGRYGYIQFEKGSINEVEEIEGAILVNGNYKSYYNATFGSQAENIKSYITGTKEDNVSTNSQLVSDNNYIDFEKMYSIIMNTSNLLANSSKYSINSAKVEISKPGIYSINNTSNDFPFLIKNYDKDNLYIFNYFDVYAYVPSIKIMETGSANAVSMKEYIESGKYTGNIIFNYPNASLVRFYNHYNNDGFSGNIIAPKAVVEIELNFSAESKEEAIYLGNPYTYTTYHNYYYGTIISNSISGGSYHSYIRKANYSLDKIIADKVSGNIEEPIDYTDDYYKRDYSIKDLLENYSLVTLGHKEIDTKSRIVNLGNTPGSIKLFHITGPALIKGDLYTKVYTDKIDDYYDGSHTSNIGDLSISGQLQKFDRTVFDLESNKVTETHIEGTIETEVKRFSDNKSFSISNFYIQPWDNITINTWQPKKNTITVSEVGFNPYNASGLYNYQNNYLNFDRLYNNIIAEQSAIEEGTSIKKDGKVAHIKVGGVYNIDNINDLDEIVFDNFDEEKDKLTIITIKNEGDINFPLISKDTGNYKGIVTNDYYGKTEATHFYEQDTFVQDSYHGNIIWNVPNATFIKLKENAPFAGHLIAPNADVDTPETHFAGCFIVNSIYGEGNTEAHFYPLTSTATYDVPEYDDLNASEVERLNNLRLKRLLGGKASIIETNIIGDEEQFRKDEAKLNDIIDREEAKTSNNLVPIIDILQNPLTKRNIIIIISALIIISVTLCLTFKKKIKR